MKSQRFLCLFFYFIFFASGSFLNAVPESLLPSLYSKKVLPYWEGGLEKYFKGSSGLSIFYKVFEAPQPYGALVILPGRGEPAKKYAELIYDLRKIPLTLYVLDLQGQGKSERFTQNPEIGYVRSFQDYVSDLSFFTHNILLKRNFQKRFLLAHSTGGTISALELEKEPGLYDALALVAPMISINTHPWSESLASFLSSAACMLGQGKKYALGRGNWDPNLKLKDDKTTSSPIRFTMAQNLLKKEASLRLGGPSYEWVHEALKATFHLRNISPNFLSTPTLLMIAGQDQVVHNGESQRFCEKLSECKLQLYPDSLHNILFERDEIRDRALKDLLDFFSKF